VSGRKLIRLEKSINSRIAKEVNHRDFVPRLVPHFFMPFVTVSCFVDDPEDVVQSFVDSYNNIDFAGLSRQKNEGTLCQRIIHAFTF